MYIIVKHLVLWVNLLNVSAEVSQSVIAKRDHPQNLFSELLVRLE